MPRFIRYPSVYDVDAEDERRDKVLEDYLRGGDNSYRKVVNIRDAVPDNLTMKDLWMIVGSILIGSGLLYLAGWVRALEIHPH